MHNYLFAQMAWATGPEFDRSLAAKPGCDHSAKAIANIELKVHAMGFMSR